MHGSGVVRIAAGAGLLVGQLSAVNDSFLDAESKLAFVRVLARCT